MKRQPTYVVVRFDDVWFFYPNKESMRENISRDASPRQNGHICYIWKRS